MSVTGAIYVPGERCPTSGQWGVVNQQGTYLGREITMVEDKQFPPVDRLSGEYGYRLRDVTIHRW